MHLNQYKMHVVAVNMKTLVLLLFRYQINLKEIAIVI